MSTFIEHTISTAGAQQFYSWLGARHDLGARFEREAKAQAMQLLDLRQGQRVLDLGSGTGSGLRLMRQQIGPTGSIYAVDLSPVMAGLSDDRGATTTAVQANAIQVPFGDQTFDRILSTYLLDLLPASGLTTVLAECRRLLKPDGRVVLVSLTAGVDNVSRAVVGAWQSVYRIHPLLLGGCRPVPLVRLVRESGLAIITDRVVVQGGVPSAIVVAGHG